jgi:signal peptidase
MAKLETTDILLILLALIISSVTILAVAGLISFIVTMTDSMGPTFPSGALAVFLKQESYSVGDVVLFKVHGYLVAHRIVAETERGFKTKGDASRSVDPWVVPPDAVRGKMIFSIPFLGWFINLMRIPVVFAGVTTALFAFLTLEAFFEPEQPRQPQP